MSDVDYETQREQHQEHVQKLQKIQLEHAEVALGTIKADLRYAETRAMKVKYESRYWQAMAAHPGEHDALFQKVLEEVQLMRKALDVYTVTGGTSIHGPETGEGTEG